MANRVVVTEPVPGEQRTLWTPPGVRPVWNPGVPAPPPLRQRVRDWLDSRLGVALVVGLFFAGVTQLADKKTVGWLFETAIIPTAILPPALFVGLRPDQRRARKRFVGSAIVSGVLVSVFSIAYGWPAGVLGLLLVLVVLVGQ